MHPIALNCDYWRDGEYTADIRGGLIVTGACIAYMLPDST